ncbi:MAG: acyl-CoA thioesterase [Alphaproteobacteria bacterium]|nr:acyl-CoA thioesterase [Alphaproteobacteria bacterium]
MTQASEQRALARFRFPVRVRFADTDLNGHVFFANYLVYMDESFMAYLHEIDHRWDRLEEMGLRMYYVDVGCQLLAQARFEDELDAHCEIARIGNSSLRAEATIVRPSDGELMATGHIAAVIIDSEADRPARVPDSFREAVARYQGTAV